jgi:hypothetical protein
VQQSTAAIAASTRQPTMALNRGPPPTASPVDPGAAAPCDAQQRTP